MSVVPRYKLFKIRIGSLRFFSSIRLNSIDDVVLLHCALHFTNSNGVTIKAQKIPETLPAKKCWDVVASPINFKAAQKLTKLTTELGGTDNKGGISPRYSERGLNLTLTDCIM